MEAQLTVQSLDGAAGSSIAARFTPGGVELVTAPEAIAAVLGRVLELRLSLAAVRIALNAGLRFQFSLWQGGLPFDAIPHQGWIEMRTTNPAEMAG